MLSEYLRQLKSKKEEEQKEKPSCKDSPCKACTTGRRIGWYQYTTNGLTIMTSQEQALSTRSVESQRNFCLYVQHTFIYQHTCSAFMLMLVCWIGLILSFHKVLNSGIIIHLLHYTVMIPGSVDFLVEFHKVCLACFIFFNSSFYFDSSWVLYFSELDLGCSSVYSVF